MYLQLGKDIPEKKKTHFKTGDTDFVVLYASKLEKLDKLPFCIEIYSVCRWKV